MGTQQLAGSANVPGTVSLMVKPLKVTPVDPKVAVESKVPTPVPTNATPAGFPFNNPVKLAAVGSFWTLLFTSGKTSMR